MLFCCKNSIKVVNSSLKIEFTTLIHILPLFQSIIISSANIQPLPPAPLCQAGMGFKGLAMILIYRQRLQSLANRQVAIV